MFCIYIRKTSKFCPIQYSMIGFITEMVSVYRAVRTGALNKMKYVSFLKGLKFLCVMQPLISRNLICLDLPCRLSQQDLTKWW